MFYVAVRWGSPSGMWQWWLHLWSAVLSSPLLAGVQVSLKSQRATQKTRCCWQQPSSSHLDLDRSHLNQETRHTDTCSIVLKKFLVVLGYAFHFFSYEDWSQYIWVKHTVRQTAIVQLDTDVKAGDPWPPKLSLTHADVHLLMSANQWTTRKRRGDRTTQVLCNRTIQVLYRDPDPQRRHLQS